MRLSFQQGSFPVLWDPLTIFLSILITLVNYKRAQNCYFLRRHLRVSLLVPREWREKVKIGILSASCILFMPYICFHVHGLFSMHPSSPWPWHIPGPIISLILSSPSICSWTWSAWLFLVPDRFSSLCKNSVVWRIHILTGKLKYPYMPVLAQLDRDPPYLLSLVRPLLDTSFVTGLKVESFGKIWYISALSLFLSLSVPFSPLHEVQLSRLRPWQLKYNHQQKAKSMVRKC